MGSPDFPSLRYSMFAKLCYLLMLFPNPTVFDVGVFGLFDLLNEFGEAAVRSFGDE